MVGSRNVLEIHSCAVLYDNARRGFESAADDAESWDVSTSAPVDFDEHVRRDVCGCREEADPKTAVFASRRIARRKGDERRSIDVVPVLDLTVSYL
jgi:hypothetical protein